MAQPVQGADCGDCVGGNSCYCCDGNTGSCDCLPESGGDGCNGAGDEGAGYLDLVCAANEGEAEQFCNNAYNPIPLNQNLIILLFAGAIVGLTFFFNPRSLFTWIRI